MTATLAHKTGVPALAAVALCLLAAPAPALAKPGDATCVWNHLSDPLHGMVLAEYQQGGKLFADLPVLAQLAGEVGRAKAVCQTTISGPGLSNGLTAIAIHEFAAHDLSADAMTPERIDAAWAAVPPADRARAEPIFLSLFSEENGDVNETDSAFIRALVFQVGAQLGLPGPRYRVLALFLISEVALRHYDV